MIGNDILGFYYIPVISLNILFHTIVGKFINHL